MVKSIHLVKKSNGNLVLRPHRIAVREQVDEVEWHCGIDDKASVQFETSPFSEDSFAMDQKTGMASTFSRRPFHYTATADGRTCRGIIFVAKRQLTVERITIQINPLSMLQSSHRVKQLAGQIVWECPDDPDALVVFKHRGAFEREVFEMDEETGPAVGEWDESGRPYEYLVLSQGDVLDPEIIIEPPPDEPKDK